jgi:hypothetical protein
LLKNSLIMTKKITKRPNDPEYWAWRATASFKGRPKAFKDQKHLWKLACQYFQWVDDNPFIKTDFIRSGERAGEVVKQECQRPYTWSGLETYLCEKNYLSTLEDYKANTDGRYADFADVIRAIEGVMRTQKFDGATVGAFCHNIIARDLGLVDKHEQDIRLPKKTIADLLRDSNT